MMLGEKTMLIYSEELGVDHLDEVTGPGDRCPSCRGGELTSAGEDYLVCEDGCGTFFVIYDDGEGDG